MMKSPKAQPKRRGRKGKKRSQRSEGESGADEDMDVSLLSQPGGTGDRSTIKEGLKHLLVVSPICGVR